MKNPLTRLARLALLFTPAVVFVAQTQHITPFTGTWKLNVAKSKLSPGPGLQSATVTVAPDGTSTVEGVNAQGKPLKYSTPWSGGKEVPVDGIENATIITKLQGHTLDRTMKIAGKIVQRIHAVVSPDGKTITATVTGTDPQGRQTHDVEVFEKQ